MKETKGLMVALVSAALLLTILGTWVYVNVFDAYDVSQHISEIHFEREYSLHKGYTVLSLTVDDDSNAVVQYYGLKMTGKLSAISVDQGSITYRLRNIDVGSELAGQEVSFVLQVPRKSVEGDRQGTWTVRFSNKSDESHATDTIVLNADGSATFDRSGDVMTEDVSSLRLRGYEELQWREEGETVTLFDPKVLE